VTVIDYHCVPGKIEIFSKPNDTICRRFDRRAFGDSKINTVMRRPWLAIEHALISETPGHDPIHRPQKFLRKPSLVNVVHTRLNHSACIA
jgi:hypothetical protein